MKKELHGIDLWRRKLSQKIARRLFTDGTGASAKRLVIELGDGRNSGGWCEAAAVDQIEQVLKEQP